jgi:hypothetical protein
MISRSFALAIFLLTGTAVWAQYSRADMVKVAADRFDTASRTLNLSTDQAARIRQLIQSKYIDIGQVKDVYRASDKSGAARKTAKDSLKAINDKYNAEIIAILSQDQLKEWKRMQKEWKGDLSMPKS